MTPLEAARLLARNGEYKESETILMNLWGARTAASEFGLFCNLMELSLVQAPKAAKGVFEDVVSSEGNWSAFWGARTLIEQGVLLEWYGELCFFLEEKQKALDALTRAASLGRDTSNMWLHLGVLYLENGELELSIRYMRRSLELYKQPGLEILDPREGHMGAFLGCHPLEFNPGPKEYLAGLLDVVKLARGRRALKSVRDLVVEMIHQFPEEDRLPKIRLLLERSLVSHSLQPGYPSL